LTSVNRNILGTFRDESAKGGNRVTVTLNASVRPLIYLPMVHSIVYVLATATTFDDISLAHPFIRFPNTHIVQTEVRHFFSK